MRKRLLAAHPHLKHLSGPNPWTALAVPVLLAVHWGAAIMVAQSGSLLFCFVMAFSAGQLCIHSAGALVHETAHRLIFRGRVTKLLFDLGLEFILASYGRQLTYQIDHVASHHPHLGDYMGDYEFEDACHAGARRKLRIENPLMSKLLNGLTLLLHGLPLGFILSDLIMPRLLKQNSGTGVRDKQRQWRKRHVSVNLRLLFIAVSVISNLTLALAVGWLGLLYHVWALSLFLGKLGVTNLGQSLSEHEGDNLERPTFSDYGLLNFILFNTGYHNEHHTFPAVPWHRLPALRAAAPDVFCNENPKSYVALWWDHVLGGFTETRANPLVATLTPESCAEPEPPRAPS
jgi:sphingolipid delta-4 desaturase